MRLFPRVGMSGTSLGLDECSCPLCGEPPPVRARVVSAPYRVVDCPFCSMRYLTPRAHEADINRLYSAPAYWKHDGASCGYSSYTAMNSLLERTFVRRLERLGDARGARLLDVGCGPGAGIAAAASLGYEAWGLDVSQSAVSIASARFPGRVCRGALSDRQFPQGSFDVITLFDVIEHLYQPRRIAADLAWHLAPRGRILIATPNVNSILSRVTGSRWVSYKIPEHVSFFSPHTLRRALAPEIEIERISSCGQYVSPDFLLKRVGDALPYCRTACRRGAELLRASDRQIYVNSGSMLVTAGHGKAP